MLGLMVMPAWKVGRKRFVKTRSIIAEIGQNHFQVAPLVVVPLDLLPMRKKDLAQGKLCFVCNLYSPSETAHGKSPWIHKEEQRITHDIPRAMSKGLPMVYLTTRAVPLIRKQQQETHILGILLHHIAWHIIK